MSEYIICTDSACDLSPALLAEMGIPSVELTYHFEGGEEMTGRDMPISDFYAEMRAGRVARTAAVNTESFAAMFESILAEGKDVLYIGLSSGISSTYNSGRLAAEALAGKYPDRRILTVDSLSASAGLGLLLDLTLRERARGATVEEAAAFAERTKLHICHWFTVDDLTYLKRGGRVSPATAVVGNLLSFKPVMHMDNDGHLVKVGVARGRRKSLDAMVDKFKELSTLAPECATVYISQADCREDAEYVAACLKEQTGAIVKVIADVGSVIGAHAGPGTFALFFVGKER